MGGLSPARRRAGAVSSHPVTTGDIVDIHRPAVVTTPLVLDSPHSGSFYPADFAPVVGPERYRRAEDMDVDVLFDQAPEVGAVLMACRFGRIYCDVNRAADDLDPASLAGGFGAAVRPSAKARLGKGVVWQAVPPDGAPLYGGPLPAAAVRARLRDYWEPYHQALGALLDETHARFGRVFHLDCHSMQAVSNAMHEEGVGRPRPDIVLSDRDGTTTAPDFLDTARRLLEAEGFEVRINDPYKGAEIVRRYGRPAAGRHSLQLELNRRLYMDEERLQRTADFAGTKARLDRFLEALALAVQTL
jgi:N-formylglutamate deformylase